MKKLFLTFFLLSLFCAGMQARAAKGNKTFSGAKDYVLYYGAASDSDIAELAKYDVVIIDPAALGSKAAKQISELKKNGCVVLGYLSYIEVAEWHRYRKSVPESWLLKLDGRLWVPWGNNNAVDMTLVKWHEMLVSLTKSEVMDYGCDGVFMDTLADLENPAIGKHPGILKKQLDGMNEMFKALRRAYPDILLISNWTLEKTLDVCAPYVDAVCWEDFEPKDFTGSGWADATAERLDSAARKYGFKVYTLRIQKNEGKRREMETFSRKRGYIPYATRYEYGAGFERKKKN